MNALPPFEQQYPTIGPLITAVAAWYRKWRLESEPTGLENCSADDVDRMAKDIGLTMGELRALERTDQPLLLPRMLLQEDF